MGHSIVLNVCCHHDSSSRLRLSGKSFLKDGLKVMRYVLRKICIRRVVVSDPVKNIEETNVIERIF